jgi:hypothetical protein
VPFVPLRLRRAAVITAMLTSAFTPSCVGIGAVAVTVTGITAVTVITVSEAEARERVRDHRKRRCPPHAAGPGCVPR